MLKNSLAGIYEAYSRILVDNHITEDDPSFMSKFAPAQYAAMIKKAGVDSAMVYACCHNGNCYYPTKVGHMHSNLKGKDIFGQTIGLETKRLSRQRQPRRTFLALLSQ
jgi:hypothetical protein